MVSFRQRYESFKHNHWSVPGLSAREMARAGFHYNGEGDLVECARCDIAISNWTGENEIVADPFAKHKQYSPNCNFNDNEIEDDDENENDDDDDEENYAKIMFTENANDNDALKCIVCFDRAREIMFEPCHHVVCCDNCARAVFACVTCRAAIKQTVKIFL